MEENLKSPMAVKGLMFILETSLLLMDKKWKQVN